MPGGGIPVPGLDPWGNGVLEQGVLNGTVTEARLDEQVVRALTPYFALGQDDADFPTTTLSRIVFASNASDVAYQVAKEGITLVKNVGSGRGLPLVLPRSLGRESTDRNPASENIPHLMTLSTQQCLAMPRSILSGTFITWVSMARPTRSRRVIERLEEVQVSLFLLGYRPLLKLSPSEPGKISSTLTTSCQCESNQVVAFT